MSAPVPWLYLDADGFFASCEEAADPALHGRPVGVVAGDPYAEAPLIAVNTVANRFGMWLDKQRSRVASTLRVPSAAPRHHGRLTRRAPARAFPVFAIPGVPTLGPEPGMESARLACAGGRAGTVVTAVAGTRSGRPSPDLMSS